MLHNRTVCCPGSREYVPLPVAVEAKVSSIWRRAGPQDGRNGAAILKSCCMHSLFPATFRPSSPRKHSHTSRLGLDGCVRLLGPVASCTVSPLSLSTKARICNSWQLPISSLQYCPGTLTPAMLPEGFFVVVGGAHEEAENQHHFNKLFAHCRS